MKETNVKAFLLIQSDRNHEPLAQQLRTLPGLRFEFADDVSGPFDAVALVDAESSRDLLETLVPRIRALPGVMHVLSAPLGDAASAPLLVGDRAA